jgi:hypothetical protein
VTTRLESLRGLLAGTTAVATFLGVLFVPAGLLHAESADLFITEYVEGSGTNQAIEIYNPTDVTVSLSASGYMLAFYLDGSTMIGGGVPLIGVVPPGGTWVVTPTNASAPLLARANQAFGAGWFDGNDAVALLHGGMAVDVLGQIGMDPGAAWGSGATSTADHTLRRKAEVTSGDANGTDAFDPSVQWDGYPIDSFDGLGSVGETVNEPVSVTCPAPVETTQGMGASAAVSSTDADGMVVSLAATAVKPVDPGTITVASVTAATVAGGIATGMLSVSPTTPVGAYSVTVAAANDDATPQTATCAVAITVDPVTVDSLRSLIDAMVAAGDVAPSKAPLLRERLDRIDAARAAGRDADAAAQLRAFGNQVAGLSPRWVSVGAADVLETEARLLGSSG